MEEFKTYETVMIQLSNGEEQEFAIIEEFTYDEKQYIVVSPVQGDEIQEGMYLYRTAQTEEGLEISRIEDAEEFAQVSAYFEAR